jgi:flagellar biosynthesis/type III secretory pathway protein FliH
MNHDAPDQADLSDAILGKADALIRRNRPDGVGSDSEELPLLTEVVDDIPSLNEFLSAPAAAAQAPAQSDGRHPVVIGLSQEQVNILITDAVDRAQRDILKHQDRVVFESVERAKAENAVAHQAALQAALAKGRADGRAEGQSQGFAEGLARGRSEHQATMNSATESARRDAHQQVILQFSEQLIELDSYIAQSVDAWLAKELPQIISGEIESLVERLKTRTAAHMRATLLPDISNKLSALLDTKL